MSAEHKPHRKHIVAELVLPPGVTVGATPVPVIYMEVRHGR